ncbi:hypothetical protein DPMN_126528 [Dreissena polymorpha]|uniref:Secreted protein n=1 Tax=Dreissena polymorpha TaxID=45954 RepID=A0A9D4H0B3_DREPO|nr:hypothetical protein DPMN_126528 [Dreissena polymorpha]
MTRLLRQGSADSYIKIFFLLLARCEVSMAGPLLTSPAFDPNPKRFFQHAERTEYLRFSTIPFFSQPNLLEVLACPAASVPLPTM